ncbi:chaperone protein dnaJ 8, chloroplastic-like [Punica granatum]|uniref:J domain-containing protein n=2 Tax=Punica granatum TaxID=22663 RepID=A0A218WAN5_PUNGR|nr:chaperone protein dnaJ 8, chloroplastic-like [Punica granatum]OWM69559.1 hypothetical protein CDL15_Pgr014020 [Punica granatum]PKI40804.1 hypothetical protein CRG98_038815 [Punica granatum]
MASAVGLIGKNAAFVWNQPRDRTMRRNTRDMAEEGSRAFVKVFCSYPSPGMDPYKTLRIQRGASMSEVKRAFRKLALQYHPDVCRGSSCRLEFHLINEAYGTVMNNLRGESDRSQMCQPRDQGVDEPMRGVDNPDWDLWEEWMGWEGAGIRDYSSHINPYI